MLQQTLQKIFTKKHMKQFGINLVSDSIGSLLYGLAVYNFVSAANFATGGVTGIALIINYFTGLPLGILQFMVNIPIILLSFKFLGKWYILRTFQTVVINTIFCDHVCTLLPTYNGNPFLAAIFGGILAGVGLGLIYENKSCSGGSDLIIMSIRTKKPHMSVGQITVFTDGLILCCGSIVYKNIDALLYGLVFSALMTIVMDKLMAGFVSGKMAIIITDPAHYAIISSKLNEKLDRGITLIRCEGTYSHNEKSMLLCACSRSQVPVLRSEVKNIHKDAIIIVSSFDEVYGYGFSPIDG